MERDELHSLVMLLKEEIKAGRAKLSSSETIASLDRIRLADDGKVDPSTVDGTVRALGLAIAASKEIKQMSLQDVQSNYFDSLEVSFGELFSQMKAHNLSPQQMAEAVASNEEMVEAFENSLPAFSSDIRDFWRTNGPVVEAHLENLRGLKSVFGGDMFPSYTSNIACSVGLYMDTVVLPDPLLSVTTLAGGISNQNPLLYTTKHALNALGYRELALADVQPPIVVIAPDHSCLDDSYRAAMIVAGQVDTLLHAARMFGRSFSTVPEFIAFLKQFADAHELASQIVEPRSLLFDSEWSGTLSDQIERYATEMMPGKEIGEVVYHAVLGRMIMTNDVLMRSSRYAGSPLIDAPTSWRFLQWKYEYDSKDLGRTPSDKRDALITKELGSSMLSGIPPESLVMLRREGALAQLREIIGTGIEQINSASGAEVSAVGEAVILRVSKVNAHANSIV